MAHMTPGVQDAGEDAHDSAWVDGGVRAGMVAYGLVHLVVGWLALRLALGSKDAPPDSAGALHELARQPLGSGLVWAVAVGMVLLVVWRLLEAFFGHRDEDGATLWRKRAMSIAKAGVYGALGWSAVMVAVGQGSRGGRGSATARLMDLPAGTWLVGAVGLVVAGYGLNLLRRGVTEKFAEHLSAEGRSGPSGTAYVLLGKAGHVAKGVAIVIVGGLMVHAAVTHQPRESGGLDKALQAVLEQPFGPFLLGVIAVGIACYGLFCFARARHLHPTER